MFRLLRADEIDVRVKQVIEKGAVALLYKTARTDMDILDETVGPENWYKTYREIKGNLYCTLHIKCGDEWIGKEDCGIESRDSGDGNEKKGEASDAFKRAGFCWGIGRELYTAPFILIDLPREKYTWNGKEAWKLKKNAYLTVAAIEYDDNRRITKLVINGTSGQVFAYPKYTAPPAPTPAPVAGVDTSAECAKLVKEIMGLGSGAAARVDAFIDRLWPGYTLDELSVEQLRVAKVKLAKAVAKK